MTNQIKATSIAAEDVAEFKSAWADMVPTQIRSDDHPCALANGLSPHNAALLQRFVAPGITEGLSETEMGLALDAARAEGTPWTRDASDQVADLHAANNALLNRARAAEARAVMLEKELARIGISPKADTVATFDLAKITASEVIRLRRSPRVLIQSNGWFWRADSAGYTDRAGAAIYSGADAYSATNHCGPEKEVRYHILDEDPGEPMFQPPATAAQESLH